MLKHNRQRLLFILTMGGLVPCLSGIASVQFHGWNYLAGTFLFFIVLYSVAWAACRAVLQPLRRHHRIERQPFARVLVLCSISACITAAIVGSGAGFWIATHPLLVVSESLVRITAISAALAVGFTLLFESVYLAEERREERRRAARLEQKYQRAELDVLKHQLEPHFMANALTNLLFLIGDDPVRAQQFTRKLAQVDEYFLRNRDKNLVTLAEELAFVKDYYFLLGIRHQDKLKLEIAIPESEVHARRIVPCALQIPLENAIKHNMLSAEAPLVVRIALEDGMLTVTNNLRPKPYLLATTHLGLHNLSERYRLACRSAIDVCKTAEQFIVRLPLVA
jgi:two-component system, LytTR family, sensor kinase